MRPGVTRLILPVLDGSPTLTRVLEVIYSFPPGDSPVFIGQQVDVFVKAE